MTRKPPLVILEPDSKPLGTSYKEWCKEWCRWFLSIPKVHNPALDNRGGSTSTQIGSNVTFLCQTFEPVKPFPYRNVRAPEGSSFFMPIINWISFLGGKERNETDLASLAKERMDEVVKLSVCVDGEYITKDLKKFRVVSPPVQLFLPDNNILDAERGYTSIVADGFWIFFYPISKSLNIETYGACMSGKTEIGVKYHIDLVS